MGKRAGIDEGGTFTGLILVDDVSGEVKLAKVPATVANQAFWRDPTGMTRHDPIA